MKKLSLNAEALDVETFETSRARSEAAGTVHGQASTYAYPCRTYAGTCGAFPFAADDAVTHCV
jgi:hypothetical protein